MNDQDFVQEHVMPTVHSRKLACCKFPWQQMQAAGGTNSCKQSEQMSLSPLKVLLASDMTMRILHTPAARYQSGPHSEHICQEGARVIARGSKASTQCGSLKHAPSERETFASDMVLHRRCIFLLAKPRKRWTSGHGDPNGCLPKMMALLRWTYSKKCQSTQL